MTYNQVIKRFQTIALAHRQVRHFARGQVAEFLTDKTIPYAAVFLQEGTIGINPGTNAVTVGFRIFFLDMVHVSADAKENELDVLSDMLSVAMDFIAQASYPGYTDWKISLTNTGSFVTENIEDMLAGCYVDLVVAIGYDQNVCEPPSTWEPEIPINERDVKVYNHYYTATGSEGLSISTCGADADLALASPTICGKKILLITREYSPLYRVSNLPQSTEYTWNDSEIGLGLETMPGERFLILYRAY